MIDLQKVFYRITNRRVSWVSDENSRDKVEEIRRNTRPKTSRRRPKQPKLQQHKLETKQSRRQIAYQKRKRTLHKGGR